LDLACRICFTAALWGAHAALLAPSRLDRFYSKCVAKSAASPLCPSLARGCVFDGDLRDVCVMVCGRDGRVTGLLFAASSFSLCLAQFSLTARAPPEPATYQATAGRFTLDSFSRPLHLATAHVLLGALSPREFYDDFSKALHLLVAFFPLLWLVGVLPPPSAALDWLLDQYNTVLLGGTASASQARALAHALVGTMAVLLLYVAFRQQDPPPDLDRDQSAPLAAAAVLGFLLSLSWWEAIGAVILRFSRQVRSKSHLQGTIAAAFRPSYTHARALDCAVALHCQSGAGHANGPHQGQQWPSWVGAGAEASEHLDPSDPAPAGLPHRSSPPSSGAHSAESPRWPSNARRPAGA
jgi:hypothetical protein